MKKITIKKILLIIFFLLTTYFIIYYFLTPVFKVTNYTNYPINYTNLQVVDRGNDNFTEYELKSINKKYKLDFKKSNNERLHFRNTFTRNNVYVGLDFNYGSDYWTINNEYELNGVTFTKKPDYIGQVAYCSFKVEVYPNNKTIVTPSRKSFCLQPFYYHPR